MELTKYLKLRQMIESNHENDVELAIELLRLEPYGQLEANLWDLVFTKRWLQMESDLWFGKRK